jgi:hypothetical protein
VPTFCSFQMADGRQRFGQHGTSGLEFLCRTHDGGGVFNCANEPYLTTVPGGFSETVEMSWTQDLCSDGPASDEGLTVVPNPNCPGTPVPTGTYRILTNWERFQAPPVTITIGSL